MIRLHETVRVARSAADCYRYPADFSTCAQWDPGVYRARKLAPGTPAIGTEFAVTASLFGHRSTLDYTITGLRPNARIELEMQGTGLRSVETIVFEENDAGEMTIDYRADLSLSGALRAGEIGTIRVRPLLSPSGAFAQG